MATLGNLRTRVSAVLSIKADQASHADQTEADARANEAVRDILLRTGVKVTTEAVSLSAGTGDYTLTSTVMRIKEAYVTSSGRDYLVEQVAPAEILEMRRASSTTSAPTRFYALQGADLLMVYPTPSASETLTLYTVERPTEMSDATHDPANATYGGIPVEFHQAIENYMLWKLADMDDDQSSSQGERYRVRYEGDNGRGGDIAKILKYVNLKGGKLGRARVNPRRPRVPSDPAIPLS